LALPFSSKHHKKESVPPHGIKVTAASNIIVLKKEIKETPAEIKKNIIVA
jgi:hypothetical protein